MAKTRQRWLMEPMIARVTASDHIRNFIVVWATQMTQRMAYSGLWGPRSESGLGGKGRRRVGHSRAHLGTSSPGHK